MENIPLDLSLDELIDSYMAMNTQEKELSDKISLYSRSIKDKMRDEKIMSRATDKATATLTERHYCSFNGDMLLDIMKKQPDEIRMQVIKTIESVDQTKLTELVSTGKISAETIVPAEIQSISTALSVKKLKEAAK